jgi:hypothetical protein
MFNVFLLWFGALFRVFRSRRNLVFENFALRQQLAVTEAASAASLSIFDKLFWIAVRRFWSQWKQSLIVVTPETVIRWHSYVLEADLQSPDADWKKTDAGTLASAASSDAPLDCAL